LKHWRGGLEPGFTQFRTFIHNRRNYILLYKESGSARFYHIHLAQKSFLHVFQSEEWPTDLIRLPTFSIPKTKTDGLILVGPPPKNTKQYCLFTPDLQGKGFQVKYTKDDAIEWTSHLVFSFPKSDYAYEVEYSVKGRLRISYFRVDPEYEGGVIIEEDSSERDLDEIVVYSFELEETENSSSEPVKHTYWRVLLVRKHDGHILVVTFEIDPKDPKALSHFGTSTYDWAERKHWDFNEAFRHRFKNLQEDFQYLMTYHNGTGKRGLYKVDNYKETIIITNVSQRNDEGLSFAPGHLPARGWTHHAIIL